jgi:prevent-host-death family protein
MEKVGAVDAKTQVARLPDSVAKGKKITITRQGVPAAMLVPVAEDKAKLTHRDIVVGMRALRQQVKRGNVSIKGMVDEGRRAEWL